MTPWALFGATVALWCALVALVQLGLYGLPRLVCRWKGHAWKLYRKAYVKGFRPVDVWRCARCQRYGAEP